MTVFTLYLSGTAPDRISLLDTELARAKTDPVAWENFLAATAASSSPDTVTYLRRIEQSGNFHIEQAGESRSLYLRFAANRKLSLETDTGCLPLLLPPHPCPRQRIHLNRHPLRLLPPRQV